MGPWKWLNLAVVVVAGWYVYLDVVVADWNPYEPAFHTLGTVRLAACAAEVQTATHEGRTAYRVRLESITCWTNVKRAWLVADVDQRVPFSGSRHRFRAALSRHDQHTSTLPLTVEVERWDSTRETATVSMKETR
jgi:hypothetical protein